MKIKVTENDLIKIKSFALTEYKQKSVKGLDPDAFWGKCVLDAVMKVLNLDIELEFETNFVVKDK